MPIVLLIGFAAEAMDLSSSPVTVDELRDMIAAGDAEVANAGYEVTRVLIGNGVRGLPKFTELFEELVNAPQQLT